MAPMAPMEPAYVAETLNWCNEMRAQHEVGPPLERLPRGIRGNPWSCPCSKASGLRVGTMKYWTEAEWGDEPGVVCEDLPLDKIDPVSLRRASAGKLLPQAVRAFVHEFDEGSFPQYDIEEKEEA